MAEQVFDPCFALFSRCHEDKAAVHPYSGATVQPGWKPYMRFAGRIVGEPGGVATTVALGEGVGYQIRLESRVSERTRIRFVTEGILLRQMSFDATLRGIAAIVFDEFHERHLYGDISLARALQIQRSTRPDL